MFHEKKVKAAIINKQAQRQLKLIKDIIIFQNLRIETVKSW